MKHFVASLLAICVTVAAFGQLKPEAGDKGLGFRITGLSNIGLFNFGQTNISDEELEDPLGVLPGMRVRDILPQELLFGRCYLTETNVLRMGLSAAMTNEEQTTITGTEPNVDTDIFSLNAFSVGILLGLEKHLASAAQRIDPYIGGQVGFSYLGGIKVEEMRTVNEPDYSMSRTTVTNYPAGWGVNADVLAGFNFFVSNNFALGAEMSLGFFMINMGGDYTQTDDQEINDNGDITTTNTEINGTAQFKQMGVRTGSTAGINASIFW